MVDPNRKINILTKDQETFLEECEKEFGNRFTVTDEEYMNYCSKPVPPPPIIENWQQRYNNQKFRRGGFHKPQNNYRWDNGRNHNRDNRYDYDQRSSQTAYKRPHS